MMFLGLLAAAWSARAAPVCAPAAAAGFVAHYRQAVGKHSRSVVLVHRPGWAAYRIDNGLVQLWQRLPRDHVELYRVFPGYRRSILYSVSGLGLRGRSRRWTQVENLVTPSGLAIDKRTDTACGLRETRHGTIGTARAELSWYPASGLIERLRLDREGQQTRYVLTRVEGADRAEQLIAQWRAYPATDFADIGDNEADPFLSKMIDLGFVERDGSGLYDHHGYAAGH